MDVDESDQTYSEEAVLDRQIEELRVKIQQLIQRKKMLDEKLKDFENLENIFADEFTENQKSRNLSISQKLDKLLEQTESKRSTKKN